MKRVLGLIDTTRTSAVDQLDADYELLISVAARLNRASAILLSNLETPLTFRQYRTLTRVMGGYTSLSQLAKRGNLSLPTVSENVDGLVKRGLMETTQSTADRRAIVLNVTEAGARAAEAGREAISGFVGTLLADIEPERRRELQLSLQTVYESATAYFAQNLVGRPERASNS